METGKHVSATAPAHISSISAQTEKRMDGQAPVTAVYIHTVPAPPPQLLFQPPTIVQGPETPSIPSLYTKEMLPLLTLHIVGGLPSQRGDSVPVSAARPKSAGKHVCTHCGRDCMKPSVLEKHLRCHTGERPYPCNTCGVSFKTQSNLYKHKRTQAHARISYESGQSSQESISSSRETSTSSSSLDDPSKQPGSLEKEATDRITDQDALKVQTEVSEQCESSPVLQNKGLEGTITDKDGDHKPSLTAGRHLPLKRQEATLFSKQWDTTTCKVKSQSHESTDSGFSESSDHYPSPSMVIPLHSMESLIESTQECPDKPHCTPLEGGDSGQEPKDNVKEKEQRTLEERISQLISENSAVVEDKQLENVRPRKTVLSKQGSIDLPMPYTYKDSFHFDMRISKSQNVGLRRNKYPGLYSSVPTQPSTNMEHAPLTRSNSLPFSVALLQPEGNNQTLFSQRDYVTGFRRGSSGQLNPSGFTTKPVNQQSSTHRLLVRQTAVDCNHATEALFMGSSVEKAGSCDGEGGDICGEPSGRKFRRQKSQKFAYNKWYMYGGGTFRKLYSTGANGDSNVVKGRKPSEAAQALQKSLSTGCKETTLNSTVSLHSSTATVCSTGVHRGQTVEAAHLHCSSLRKNLSLSALPTFKPAVTQRADTVSLNHKGLNCDAPLHLGESKIPSDRKKLRTNQKIMETDANTPPPPPHTDCVPKQDTNLNYVNQGKGLSPLTKTSAVSVITSSATYMPVSAKTSSFLPKYQLKLPNATEHGSIPAPPAVHKLTKTTRRDISQSPSHFNQLCNSPSCTDVVPPVTSQMTVQKMNNLYQIPPRTETLRHSSTLAVSHRPFAGNTITTTCRHDAQAGVCSTSVHSSFSSPVVKTPRHTDGGSATHSQSLPVQTQISGTTAQSSHSTSTSCPTSPFDLTPPADQRVFHMHTADLHICFQLISDEQLALIEPQIERQVGSTERVSLEETQAKAQSSEQVHNDTKLCEKTDNQKSLNETVVASTVNTPSSKSLLISHGQALVSPTEQNNSTLATVWDQHPGDPEEQCQPQKHSNANTCAETRSGAGHVVSTDANFQSPKSDESQTSKEHLPTNRGEEHTLPGGKVSQSGLVSQMLPGQHKLIIGPPSQGMVNKNNRRRELTYSESQHKQTNREGMCGDGQVKEENKSVVQESQDSCRTETDILGQNTRSNDMTAFSINQHKPLSENLPGGSPQSIPEPSPEASLKYFTHGCDNLLVVQGSGGWRPPNVPRSNSGLLDGASVVQCSAQKQQQTQGRAEIPEKPDGADKRPKQSQEWGRQSAEGKDNITGGEDRKAKADPIKTSQLSELYLSQTKSGMSEYPPQSAERATHMSNYLDLCASSRGTRPLESPQSQVEINNLYFSGDVDTHHQPIHICSRIMGDKVQEHLTEAHVIPLTEPTCIHNVNHQDHQLVQPDPKSGGAPAGGNTAHCHVTSTLGSHKRHGQVPKSTTEITSSSAGSTVSGDSRVTPSRPLHSQHEDKQDSNIPAALQSTYQDSYSKSEDANTCQSFLLAAHFHSYQVGPSSAVRPVQACPDYMEDTSSSDEEGKLIIEL